MSYVVIVTITMVRAAKKNRGICDVTAESTPERLTDFNIFSMAANYVYLHF